ncbi:aminotransferase class V-fold PLP-dependent enzyme [Novosphingobium arvoryzae]|uniref:Histidine decarboxylase n=1 Tax=Novosphingobium arvoryzae TaxID=1256514 RepID=A0A918R737_9SPHN|nr:aminotransferase class V-fold PLP-dependent enzyme [Novosphingobium arvoryzae]GGZ88291.1 histidine decarboxylase [Novosphingobium arvoryzae]
MLSELQRAQLEEFSREMGKHKPTSVGYPFNQNVQFSEFYHWYAVSGLADMALNNIGDPRQPSPYALNAHSFENEVIDFFAPLYGFTPNNYWGIVTSSGTDGNNHGIYFGVNCLRAQSEDPPIVYVSQEAHYSIKKLTHLQQLDMRMIPTNIRGEMDIEAFEQALDPRRPALVVMAIGTTFKGGLDDQAAINAVLAHKRPVAVYRHADAALFGGYLPFTDHADLVNQQICGFDSIAVSGHKFFGFDEPLGLFITLPEVLQRQNPFHVSYLNAAVPTISCSRSALGPLKFWWQIHKVGIEGYRRNAALILKNAIYLKHRLDEIGYPAWRNEFSNTVYFRRPSDWIMRKWNLAPDEDVRLGGKLAHDIVMRHEGMHLVDRFILDLLDDLSD